MREFLIALACVVTGVVLLVAAILVVLERAVNTALCDCRPHRAAAPMSLPAPTASLSPRDAALLCKAAYGLYCDRTLSPPLGWHVHTLPNTRGFILTSPASELVIVSFRGSSAITDLATDSRLTPAPAGGHVHKGYWRMYAKYCRAATRDATRNARRVWLTGHSLGGALALLAAADLATLARPQTITTIAIGPPKVGDAGFAAHIAERILPNGPVRIIVNDYDVVPMAPIRAPHGLVHPVPLERHRFDAGSWCDNHRLTTYCRILGEN